MKPLVINNWQTGIADSAELGFADMRNLDITSIPGVAQINYSAVKTSSTTVTDLVRFFTTDIDNQVIYGIGTANLYKTINNGSTWSLASSSIGGLGGVYWKGYVICGGATTLPSYKVADGTVKATLGTITTASFHPMIVGQDDIVYGGAGRYVFSIAEVAGKTFDPTDATTFTFNAQALDLPAGYQIKTITELGKYLMLGTFKAGTITGSYKVADIFPWDRTSDTFNLPIHLNDDGVNQLLTVGNEIYTNSGFFGSLSVTNGSAFATIKRLPYTMMSFAGGNYISAYPGAIGYQNGKLLFGISNGSGASPLGVYSYNIATKALNFENQTSTGTTSGTVTIAALMPVGGDQYIVSWQDASSFGIDLVGTNRYSSYTAYCDSQFFPVGTNFQPRTFEQVSLELRQPLATGEGVRLKYRTDLSASFTTIDTIDFATYGAIQSFNKQYAIDAENIQLRIELTTGASSSTTPKLKEVRLE